MFTETPRKSQTQGNLYLQGPNQILCWVFIAARVLSLVAVSRGYPRAAMHGLLVAVASLVAELRLLACGFQ